MLESEELDPAEFELPGFELAELELEEVVVRQFGAEGAVVLTS